MTPNLIWITNDLNEAIIAAESFCQTGCRVLIITQNEDLLEEFNAEWNLNNSRTLLTVRSSDPLNSAAKTYIDWLYNPQSAELLITEKSLRKVYQEQVPPGYSYTTIPIAGTNSIFFDLAVVKLLDKP